MEGSGLAGWWAGCGHCLLKGYAIWVELVSYTIDVMLKSDKETVPRSDLLVKHGNGVFPSVVVKARLARPRTQLRLYVKHLGVSRVQGSS